MRLGERDGNADARQHAMDDRGRDHQGSAGHLEEPQQELDGAGAGGGQADDLPAELLHEPEDDDRQAGRGAGNLQRRAGEKTRDDAAGDRADQTGDDRGAGGEGDSQRQRHGDQEDDEGGRQVAAEVHRANTIDSVY